MTDENGALAHNERMLHFPQFYRIPSKLVFSSRLDCLPIRRIVLFVKEYESDIGSKGLRNNGVKKV